MSESTHLARAQPGHRGVCSRGRCPPGAQPYSPCDPPEGDPGKEGGARLWAGILQDRTHRALENHPVGEARIGQPVTVFLPQAHRLCTDLCPTRNPGGSSSTSKYGKLRATGPTSELSVTIISPLLILCSLKKWPVTARPRRARHSSLNYTPTRPSVPTELHGRGIAAA